MSKEDERLPRLSIGEKTYSWEEKHAAEEAKKKEAELKGEGKRAAALTKVTGNLRDVRRHSLPESLDIRSDLIVIYPNNDKTADQDAAIMTDDLQPGEKKRKRELDPDLTEEENTIIEHYENDIRFLEENINRSKVGALKFDAVKARFLVWIDRIGRLKGENATLKIQIQELKQEKAQLQEEVMDSRERAVKAETISDISVKAKVLAEQNLERSEKGITQLKGEIDIKNVELLAAEQNYQQLKSQNEALNEDIKMKATLMENLAKENDKLINLIEELRDLVQNQLKTTTKENQKPNDTQPPLFADMLRKPKQKIPEKTWEIQETNAKMKPTLFIKPEEGQTVKQLEKKFIDNVDPNKTKIRATIRSTRNGLMIIGEDQSEINKIIKLDSVKNQFIIETPKKQKPTVIIYGVFSEMKGEEIVERLISQNIKDESLIEEAKRETKPKFRTGPRNQERDHIVIETTNRIRLYLIRIGKIFVNFERLSIKDFLSIPKCYKCITYGHVEKHCRALKQICKFCGRDTHKAEACPDKNKNYCVPCLRFKRECKAIEEKDCPSYKAAKDKVIGRIEYG